jgi:hypothetical protein
MEIFVVSQDGCRSKNNPRYFGILPSKETAENLKLRMKSNGIDISEFKVHTKIPKCTETPPAEQ